MSETDQASALKARIADYTKVVALDIDEAQALSASLPENYVTIHLSRRATDEPVRLGGVSWPIGRRLSTRVNGKTINNVRLLERRVWDALQCNPIVLDGEPVDVRYETGGGDFERDNEGYYSALTDWIYVR